ncbi:MBL fold metallo-hydrolase [Candidatus Woesearchaeota archaeon]|nr:MBL fold metallo-hydrolase [Candidatus Woesearchaeota archaeon]
MSSKIIFLGTAGDSIVTGKQHRASGGIIIDLDDNFYHINPGPGTLVRASQYNINLRQNIALLVSSNDLIEANDTNAVIDSMTYAGLDMRGVLIAHSTVIEKTLADKQKQQISKIIHAQPGKKLAIENTDILVLKTTSETELGFKFQTSDFVLSYTGNTDYSDEIINQYENSDIIIMNVNNPGNMHVEGQLCTNDAIKIINKLKPQLVILTHFGMKMLKADPIYEAREIQMKTQVQTVAAKDGFILIPNNFNSKIKQQTLLDLKIPKKPLIKNNIEEEELY